MCLKSVQIESVKMLKKKKQQQKGNSCTSSEPKQGGSVTSVTKLQVICLPTNTMKMFYFKDTCRILLRLVDFFFFLTKVCKLMDEKKKIDIYKPSQALMFFGHSPYYIISNHVLSHQGKQTKLKSQLRTSRKLRTAIVASSWKLDCGSSLSDFRLCLVFKIVKSTVVRIEFEDLKMIKT